MDPRITLKLNGDFRRVYARGKSAVRSRVVVYCRRNRLDRNRTGYTVSRKLGKAVVRNRIRRRLREIVRLNSGNLLPGHDLIIVARARAVDSDYWKLEQDVLACLEELQLLKREETP